jgi:hypothetical protein
VEPTGPVEKSLHALDELKPAFLGLWTPAENGLAVFVGFMSVMLELWIRVRVRTEPVDGFMARVLEQWDAFHSSPAPADADWTRADSPKVAATKRSARP